jgi:hypothetical protein
MAPLRTLHATTLIQEILVIESLSPHLMTRSK